MQIIVNGKLTSAEKEVYIEQIVAKHPDVIIDKIILEVSNTSIGYTIFPKKPIFTKLGGYLISDPHTWNDAKRAEYNDSVAHSFDTFVETIK